MPVYEYRCQDCDQRFDQLVRISAQDDVQCSSCASGNVRKVVSSFAMVGGYDDTFTASEAQGGGCCGGSCGCGH